jgi:hypothetical protein
MNVEDEIKISSIKLRQKYSGKHTFFELSELLNLKYRDIE